MDFKLVRTGILIVLLCALTILLVVLGSNGMLGKKQQSNDAVFPAADTQETAVQPLDYSAWMADETFFDEEKLGDGKYEVTEEKFATFKVSSVDKDLRIVVMDDKGELISGRKFKVSVAGLGDYSDDDRDGMIFIEDVRPGEYSVSLGSVMGYTVPEKPANVTVKAGIEYKAIADISYLIKTEADIDAAAEDSAVSDAGEETTGNSGIKTVEGAVFGIDVSKYNGEIDWEKVKDEGVEYAIVRCGYRGSVTGAIVEDPYFRANMEGAIRAGVPVGVYFFTQAVDEREAIEEASAVMSLIHEYKITYPVFIDSESAGGNGRADALGVKDRSKVLQAFCETIRSGGYTAGIYASKNWFNKKLDVSKLSADNVTWLAEYADKPSYGGTYQLWQYSSAGRIPGIEGRVDMNISYLDVRRSDMATDDKEKNKDKSNTDKDKEDSEDGQDKGRDM